MRLRFTHKAIGLPQIKEADMSTLGAAYTFIVRLSADQAPLHKIKLYHILFRGTLPFLI